MTATKTTLVSAATKGQTVKAARPTAAQKAEAEAIQATDLRARWEAAIVSETKAETIWKAAKVALDNTRVVRSRIAYAAAMVRPEKGDTNLLNAARILCTDPNGKAADRTKEANKMRSSIVKYVKAGKALVAAGYDANDMTEPDDKQRTIVKNAFSAHDKETKASAEANKPKDDNGGNGGGSGTPEDGDDGTKKAEKDALTFTELLAHVARMQATADLIIKSGVVVTEKDLTLLAKTLDDLQLKLAVYAG